jgi:hypothetical protein
LAIPHVRRRSHVMSADATGCPPVAPREEPGRPPWEGADVLRH